MRLRLGDKRVTLQLVLRLRPELTVYARSEPVTVKRPTRAQAQCRLKFGELSKAAKHFTHEEVARMVGGEVVEVNGKKAIKMPDGRLLMKHQALIKAMLSGWKSPYTQVHIPTWLREASRLYTPVPTALPMLRYIKR